MSLSVGDRLGPYEIVAPLGAGGMGEVYRARDAKLNRDVAIKVLPAALANDAQYMARFEREAQVLASLNHPNIATVYGIEQGALVMELVEGADLRGPLRTEDAIPIARQIAVGLEAAHERGIVHRDLKPANIKVTPAGVVKLLDFGLAKAVEEAPLTGNSISPTLSMQMTQTGMILGTAAYMSPEQARGKPVDKRADIWAFGVVLYEMLTGRQLFGGGETVTDTLASVVKDTPDLNKLPADTPPPIRRLMERCLRKDANIRMRDIGEARIVLENPQAEAPAPPGPKRHWLPWAVAALALIAAGGAWLRPKPANPAPGVSRFMIPLPSGTGWPTGGNNATQWAPSPDGRNLALIAGGANGKNALWVRPLSATSAHVLDKTEGADFPFWSPDGQSIAFFADSKLKRVSLSGGSVQTICPVTFGPGTAAGGGGAWSPDGTILFAAGTGPLMRVAAMGSTPQTATALTKDEQAHEWPQFLPDGRHVLYLARNDEPANSAIYVQELGSANRVRVLRNPTRAVWSPPGYLLFVREATLFAQRMNPTTFQLEGEALAVAQDVRANDNNGRSSFAVSANGLLVYRGDAGLSAARQLTWVNREGKPLGVVGEPGEFNAMALSPDEKSVALLVGGRGKVDIWVLDLGTGVLTRMTRDGAASRGGNLAWSPDSQRLAFTPRKLGVDQIMVSSGSVTTLAKEPIFDEAWSPDGRSILCNDESVHQLSLLPVTDGAKPQNILATPYRKVDFHFAPDGKYVAYMSEESGKFEIYVAAFPSFAVKRKVSSGGASSPQWANGGRELFYRASDGAIMGVEVRAGTAIEASVPKPVAKIGAVTGPTQFAVTADGKRFLVIEQVGKDDAEKPEITLVLNWAAEMKQP